ncbi:MAG: CapA family protein [Clostridia bacterium]|nr:CapA family protein [Clostridia bacterium]
MKRCLLLIVLLLLPLCAFADGLDITVKGNVQGYAENAIIVTTDAAGSLVLSVSDAYGTYRTIEAEVPAGENTILWDGLAPHEERIADGKYTLSGVLTASDGTTLMDETTITIARCKNVLQFALPSSDTLYLADKEDWFCEIRMIRSGDTVKVDFYRADDPDTLLGTKSKKITAAGVYKYVWDGKLDKKAVEPGEYILRFYATVNPDYVREVQVTVAEGAAPEYKLAVSPAIMPERGMTDAEIWAIMQQPSVVADVKQANHLTIRAGKGKGAELGTVHGQSQALQVLELEGGYARIGAWNHETGDYVEGWVKQSSLKTVTPNSEYGLLIDKAAQTMTVYHRGEAIDTFAISTGLAAEKRMIRETAAGAFLTVDRIGNFDDGGFQYDYVIRYDGGNLIHQMGYETVSGKRDFSAQAALIGTKASHGCIRVPNTLSDAGINAYWLFTHLPYHTRVIILDDPEQRLLNAAAAGAEVTIPKTTPIAPPEMAEDEFELVLTVGGDAVIGTRESWWKREDAFPYYLEQNGLGYPFKNLLSIFENDDMTFVNLEGVLKADKKGESRTKEFRFRGLPEWAEVLTLASIEQVSIANNHYIDYGTAGRDATRQALTDEGIAFSGFEYNYIWEVEGLKIGFGGIRETIYEQDPTIVSSDILAMKKAGCDLIIYTCHWGTEYAKQHNELQEKIAAAATAAGADIVIGGHPHVVQGIDSVDDTLVLYSLGNLMFGGTINMQGYDGMLAQLRLRFSPEGYEGVTLKLIPVLTSSSAAEDVNDFCPVVAEGEDKVRILEKVQYDTAFELMEEMYFPAQ